MHESVSGLVAFLESMLGSIIGLVSKCLFEVVNVGAKAGQSDCMKETCCSNDYDFPLICLLKKKQMMSSPVECSDDNDNDDSDLDVPLAIIKEKIVTENVWAANDAWPQGGGK